MKKPTLVLIVLTILYGFQMVLLTSSIVHLLVPTALSVLLVLVMRVVQRSETSQKGS
ncbi:MAG: hypothetical protein LM569_00425 [Desulfurococcaceae archaeon]|nr:hypothetical protein [Desulfurococcaceae archaeon]